MSTTMTIPESRQLVERLRAREASALGELYDGYGGAVFSTIHRIARDSGAAEDLTQEVFLRAWNRIPSFNLDRGSLSTWLMTIAHNSAIDFLRSRRGQQSRRNVPIDGMERWLSAGNVVTELESSAEARRVRKAMERLEPRQRELLRLAYFEGFSQSEMAEHLSVPLGTVKTWMRNALWRLGEELRSEPVAETRAA